MLCVVNRMSAEKSEFNDSWVRRSGGFPQKNSSPKQWYVILKKGRSAFKRLVDMQFSNMVSIWMTAEANRRQSAIGPSAATEGQVPA